jgi:tetratricopeptide (TPR) repeat protein
MLSDQPHHLNELASIRMERGIALLDSGAPDALPEAIRCFDQAIELRRRLPLAEIPGFRYGLAAGWINRGDALTRLGSSENLADAVNSYTAAIELLRDPPPGDDGSFLRRLAIAKESLHGVRRRLRDCDFATLATPRGIRELEILSEVRAAEMSLQALG